MQCSGTVDIFGFVGVKFHHRYQLTDHTCRLWIAVAQNSGFHFLHLDTFLYHRFVVLLQSVQAGGFQLCAVMRLAYTH